MILNVIHAQTIQERVQALGRAISKDYQGRAIRMVVLLKGSFVFASDLLRAIEGVEVTIDFLQVASYQHQESTGNVRVLKELDETVTDRHVLVVEDIVDTGQTLSKVLGMLNRQKPASIEVCTLLDKPMRRLVEVPVRYIGITIEDLFVVGYGLDYDQRYRNLPFIGEIVPDEDLEG